MFCFKPFISLEMETPQIGNRFAVTAAHCVYDEDKKEVLPANSFSIMLGLHDRRRTKEPNRFLFHHSLQLAILCCRRQIRVSKVVVHEKFTVSANDIALLRLGKTKSYASTSQTILRGASRSFSLQPCLSS